MMNTFIKPKENQFIVAVFIALFLFLAYMVSTASAAPASAPNGQDFYSYTPVFGSITIVKQTEPNGDPTNFEFDFFGVFTVYLSDNDTATEFVESGTYTVTEVLPEHWSLIDITCDDANSSGDITTQTATIIIDSVENVTCTFTNKEWEDVFLPIISK